MLLGRQITFVPPDPLAIADLLRKTGAPGLALLHTADRSPGLFSRFSFITCDPDRVSHALDPLADDPDFARATGTFGGVPRWIGAVPYDALRHLERRAWSPVDTRPPALLDRPIWLRYPAVAVVDHFEGRVFVVGDSVRPIESLLARLRRGSSLSEASRPFSIEVTDGEPPARHVERIRAAKELISSGDLYQVNLARRLVVSLRQGEPLDLHRRLSAAAPAAFAACLQLESDLAIVSTSPELLLRAETALSSKVLSSPALTNSSFHPSLKETPNRPSEGSGLLRNDSAESASFTRLFTCPIKGTRPRGKDAREDLALIRELDEDPKENAELTMIIDVERNDLGRVAAVGSVRVLHGPGVVTHRTIHHREALLAAWARPDVSRNDVLSSMLPSGSVTGAPKIRAMEVIRNLETSRRGLYTGGLGLSGKTAASPSAWPSGPWSSAVVRANTSPAAASSRTPIRIGSWRRPGGKPSSSKKPLFGPGSEDVG